MKRNKGRADNVLAFLRALPLVDGEALGQRVQVDPWLEKWIRDIYQPEHNDGRRVVRRAGLSTARKNMKSYVVAGLLLVHLIGPEAVANGQIYSCANTREQAKVIFNMCRKMIEATPALQLHLRVRESTNTIYVRSSGKAAGSRYQALSAEKSGKHGLGADFFVYDELGEAKDRVLLDTMLDGQQTVASPLAVAISIQSPDPDQPFSRWIERGLSGNFPEHVSHLHAAPEGCSLMDRDAWLAANPTLATWKRPDAIETAAREAQENPTTEPNFRRYYLNQRVNDHASLIALADWRACLPSPMPATEAESFQFEPGERLLLGLDLSLTTDLTALVAVSADDGSRVKAWPYKPADLLTAHSDRDIVDYRLWARQGWLRTTPGKIVDTSFIAALIADLSERFTILGLAFDRYGTAALLKDFDAIGLEAQIDQGSGLRLVPWGQGYADMSPAVTALETAIVSGDLRSDGNPILTWNITNSQSVQDAAGNRKIDKSKARYRIDAAVALAMALGLKARDRLSPVHVNPWEDPAYSITRI